MKVSHFFVSNFQKGEKEKERKLFFFFDFWKIKKLDNIWYSTNPHIVSYNLAGCWPKSLKPKAPPVIEADGFWHVEQLLVSHPWEYLENLESLEDIIEVKIKDVAIEVTEIKFSRKSIKKVFSRFQAMFPCTPSVIKSEKYRQKTYKTGWPCQKWLQVLSKVRSIKKRWTKLVGLFKSEHDCWA